MFTLKEFLNVAGSGEVLKIGLRSKKGWLFQDRTIDLHTAHDVQAFMDYPVYNIYTSKTLVTYYDCIAVVLNDMGDDE